MNEWYFKFRKKPREETFLHDNIYKFLNEKNSSSRKCITTLEKKFCYIISYETRKTTKQQKGGNNGSQQKFL